MDVNIVCYVIICYTVLIGFIGLLINYMESYLPLALSRIYRYGKISAKEHPALIAKFEVPKRWFKHFYIFAGPASTITLCLIFYKYLFNGNVPEIIYILLDTLFGASRKSLVSAENVTLAIILFNIHCWKRTYETCYINVFSDKKMHIFYYFIGLFHYMIIFLCILSESEGFVRGSNFYIHAHSNFSLHKLTTTEIICALIFLTCSYMQFRTNIILAKLRRNEHSDVVSYEYKVPYGELFDYISNPLSFTEILIYIMSSIILWQTSTFHYITIFVIINQIEFSILSERWLRSIFKNYPKKRKMLIPYIW